MSNLATITNNILADSGIDDINVVVTNGSYANPAWITSLAWSKITGAPGFVTGSGSAGQVAYWSSGSAITGESNLFWDAANDRLGVNISNPINSLDVRNSTTSEPLVQAQFKSDGGTNIGGLLVAGTTQAHVRFLVNSGTWDGVGARQWQVRVGAGGSQDVFSVYSWTYGNDILVMNGPTGNVAINGTPDTASKLTITSTNVNPNVLRLENNNTTANEAGIRMRAITPDGSTFAHADIGVFATGADTGNFFIKFPFSNSKQQNVRFALNSAGNLMLGTTTATTGFSRLSLVGGEPSGVGPNTGVQLTYNGGAFGGGAITTINAAGGGLSFFNFTGNVGSETYSQVMTLFSTGNLLVQTGGTRTDNGAKLQVSGAVTAGVQSGYSYYANHTSAYSFLFSQINGANTIAFDNSSGTLQVYTGNSLRLTIAASTGSATFSSSVTATSLIRTGGTSSQFLMADGSVNTSVLPSGAYLPLAGGTLTGPLTISGLGYGNSLVITTNSTNGADIRLTNTSAGGKIYNITSTGSNNALGAGGLQFYNETDGEVAFGYTSARNFVVSTNVDAGFKFSVNGTGRFFNALIVGTSSVTTVTQQLSVYGALDTRAEVVSTSNNSAGTYFRVLNGGTLVGQSTIRVSNTGTLEFFCGGASEAVRLSISGVTGAATFSSSVTATNVILSATGYLGFGGGTNYIEGDNNNNIVRIGTNNVPRLTINASGNLGLGVTPSAWANGFTALQVRNASIWSTGNDASFTANAYYDGSNYRYIGSAAATRVYHNTDGSIGWSQSPSGTAGNAISFTQAMTLDASGNLIVGDTSTSQGARVYISRTSGSSDFATNSTLFLNASSESTTANLIRFNGAIAKGLVFGRGINADNFVWGFTNTTTPVMTLNASGNLLVGTTTDNGARLQVSGEGRFTNSDGADLIRYAATGVNTNFATKIVSGANDALVFRRQHTSVGGLDIMALGFNGNVGIGTNIPSSLLTLTGSNGGNDPYAQFRINGTGAYPNDIVGIALNNSGVQQHIRFLKNGVERFQMRYNNGNTEDNRLKFYSWITGNDFVTFNANNDNVGFGTTNPLSGTNNNGIQIDRGGHSTLLIGNGIANGGVLQSSDDSRRMFLGANIYDDVSNSWQQFVDNSGYAAFDAIGGTTEGLARILVGAPANSGYGGGDIFFEGYRNNSTSYIRMRTNTGDALYISNAGRTILGSESDNGYKLQVVNGNTWSNGVRIGRDFSIANRATVRLDSLADQPADILFGRDASALETSWGGVFWAISSRGSGEGNNFRIYRGVANTGGSEIIALNITPSAGAATFINTVTATGFFESSDSKIKTLIEDKLDYQAIANVTAKYYEKNGKKELGYFAQDFETLLPSAVSKNEDGLLNLSYREVHTAKIAYLEEEIRQLKKKYENN